MITKETIALDELRETIRKQKKIIAECVTALDKAHAFMSAAHLTLKSQIELGVIDIANLKSDIEYIANKYRGAGQ
jgi:hypothetical protein